MVCADGNRDPGAGMSAAPPVAAIRIRTIDESMSPHQFSYVCERRHTGSREGVYIVVRGEVENLTRNCDFSTDWWKNSHDLRFSVTQCLRRPCTLTPGPSPGQGEGSVPPFAGLQEHNTTLSHG